MSDQPPPPPPGSTPFPPPVGMGRTESADLKRTRGIERAAIVLVAIASVLGILTVFALRGVQDFADAYLAGELDEAEFTEKVAPAVLVPVVQGLTTLAAAVVVIIWMFRLAANLRALGRHTTWGPGWAIGGWFLPPMLYIIPLLMFGELWKASSPQTAWRDERMSPLVPTWFALYSVVPLVVSSVQGGFGISDLANSEQDLAEQLTGGQTGAVLSALVTAAAGVAFVAMARGLGARHRRFTGETPA